MQKKKKAEQERKKNTFNEINKTKEKCLQS